MKNIIGSRMAAELARKKFGDKAFASRCGKIFYIGTMRIRFWQFILDKIHGQGKSWAEALRAAGVELPATEVVLDLVVVEAPTLIADPKEAPWQVDAMPTDTDTKEPMYSDSL